MTPIHDETERNKTYICRNGRAFFIPADVAEEIADTIGIARRLKKALKAQHDWHKNEYCSSQTIDKEVESALAEAEKGKI
jgi:hypothetical protein